MAGGGVRAGPGHDGQVRFGGTRGRSNMSANGSKNRERKGRTSRQLKVEISRLQNDRVRPLNARTLPVRRGSNEPGREVSKQHHKPGGEDSPKARHANGQSICRGRHRSGAAHSRAVMAGISRQPSPTRNSSPRPAGVVGVTLTMRILPMRIRRHRQIGRPGLRPARRGPGVS